ncbi:MAG: tRNA (adenosine(37)-N6)-threonylcarbamoyltransferase complex dimerization subunit type 1 TsaB [Armatimonadota bacterium]|nr:tRNA (adenosine(37)-N6)-threonylcarbamoyltransferase complex dimerization subunit type 1 TsaB [Armatimonadota bacterium]MDR7439251.1 tRNA (adenosine(37)-N6)-threonylcarbamoyltransferase complex dimerization subunit type 1 TsaB [Armatimonadota bacterium]MDR7563286.1 tRNA (adenosine(37)-N6)-threonylcarbamoyltransferase complex dimerization subunit type 1 TsaB [Armatimonadota bacterium]MDR7567766.1 tRNA (adenosine(37)-N6)-threonylcarbamoyltransferase complex dimerization subunit type 1 TsaB [Arm
MLVLGIETATYALSVALVDGVGLRAERTLRVGQRALQWLVPAIQGMLRDADLAPEEVEGVAVSTGPGSFTGLRVGIATAVGWAHARGVPACGVSTLQALAVTCSGAPFVVPVLDARRGEVSAALFAREGETYRPLTEELTAVPEAVIRRLRELRLEDLTFVGDGLHRYASLFREAFPRAHLAPQALWSPRAATVAAVGRERLLQAGGEPLGAIQPRYGRAASFRPPAWLGAQRGAET